MRLCLLLAIMEYMYLVSTLMGSLPNGRYSLLFHLFHSPSCEQPLNGTYGFANSNVRACDQHDYAQRLDDMVVDSYPFRLTP